MSYKHISAVLKLELDPASKFILFALANYADEEGRSFPSYKAISEITCYGRSTIIRKINDMCISGLLVKDSKLNNKGGCSSNVYTINLDISVTSFQKNHENPDVTPVSHRPPPGPALGPPPVPERDSFVIHHIDTSLGISNDYKHIDQTSYKTLKDDFSQNHQVAYFCADNLPPAKFSDDFERFYRAYPIRVDKGVAHKAFLKYKFSSSQVDELIRIAEAQARQKKMIADTGCFIPRMRNCATWLNKKGWEDGLMSKEDIKQLILDHLNSKKVLSHAEESKIREALEDDEAEIIEHNNEGDY